MISLFFINGFILFISIFSVGFSTVALFHLINFFFSVYLSVCLPACLSVILPNWIASNTIFEILIIYFVWTISQNKSNFWCISLKIRNGFVIVTRVSNQKKKSKKKNEKENCSSHLKCQKMLSAKQKFKLFERYNSSYKNPFELRYNFQCEFLLSSQCNKN